MAAKVGSTRQDGKMRRKGAASATRLDNRGASASEPAGSEAPGSLLGLDASGGAEARSKRNSSLQTSEAEGLAADQASPRRLGRLRRQPGEVRPGDLPRGVDARRFSEEVTARSATPAARPMSVRFAGLSAR